MIQIDVRQLYAEQAKLDQLPEYEAAAQAAAGEGTDVVLTGQGPIWLYLRLAHALHGKARKLLYRSPLTGDVLIFNHDPR
jgi:hypothetical protein